MTAILSSGANWRAGYIALAIPLCLLSMLFTLTRGRWAVNQPGDTTAATATSPPVTIAQVLRNSGVWLHLIIFFVYTGLEITVGQWSFTVLTESRNITPQIAGTWVGVYWGAIGVGRILFGFVVDRWGVDRLLRACMIMSVAGSLLYVFNGPPAFTFIGLTMVGLALAPVYPCLMARTPQRLGPSVAPHSIGLQVRAAMLGAAVLPAGTGLVANAFGLYWVGLIALTVAGVLFVMHELLLLRDRSH